MDPIMKALLDAIAEQLRPTLERMVSDAMAAERGIGGALSEHSAQSGADEVLARLNELDNKITNVEEDAIRRIGELDDKFDELDLDDYVKEDELADKVSDAIDNGQFIVEWRK